MDIRRASLLACTVLLLPEVTQAQTKFNFVTNDSVIITGYDFPASVAPHALVLAFHQGGAGGLGEYAPIAPRLQEAGFHLIAIDQRSGGDQFGGTNRTVKARGESANFCAAAADLEATVRVARARYPQLPIILWGSSYSGALVLRLAAQHPDGVVGVLAFSPASGGPMANCRGEERSHLISVPVMVLRPRSEMARESARHQAEQFREEGHRLYVADPGTHGSSMLVPERVGSPVEATWTAVLSFLSEIAPTP